MEERGVIIPPGCSQSHAQNGIVTLWVRARTIWASALVFCFGNFPPRHSWECHCKWTVCRGILGTWACTEENPLEDAASELECTLFFVLPKVKISAFLLEGRTRRRDTLSDPGGRRMFVSPCVIKTWYSVISQKDSISRLVTCPGVKGVNVKGPSCLASYTIREMP